jgi:hypothetical protein
MELSASERAELPDWLMGLCFSRRAPRGMKWYRQFLPRASVELSPFLQLGTVPAAKPLPNDIRCERNCALIMGYTGPLEKRAGGGQAHPRRVADELDQGNDGPVALSRAARGWQPHRQRTIGYGYDGGWNMTRRTVNGSPTDLSPVGIWETAAVRQRHRPVRTSHTSRARRERVDDPASCNDMHVCSIGSRRSRPLPVCSQGPARVQ